ncbi:hypothetical protein GC163_02830 [bacterium]|nr:hypothetical protein [bacterium]
MAKAAAAGKTKIQLVTDILNSGITKTAEVVAAAKEQGVEISESTAANYKHQILKGKVGAKRGKRGRPSKKVARVVRTSGPTPVVSTDLELENLALRLIIKCGSADKARSLIDKLA